jgi:hypothetical protein
MERIPTGQERPQVPRFKWGRTSTEKGARTKQTLRASNADGDC